MVTEYEMREIKASCGGYVDEPIYVNTNVSEFTYEKPDWVSYVLYSEESASFQIATMANRSSEARQGTIKITAKDNANVYATIVVKQAGGEAYYLVINADMMNARANDLGSVGPIIETNVTEFTFEKPEWVIAVHVHLDQNCISVEHEANKSINERRGIIKISAKDIPSLFGTFEIIQEGQLVKDGDYVDEYGINHGQGISIDGTVWAPVNCGYHETDYTYGKLYQWGRKYGQGYASEDLISPEIVDGPVSLAVGQSESNSNIFYSPSASPWNWCDELNDQLWNSDNMNNPKKTEYDPCPTGWRVPTINELRVLTRNSTLTFNELGQCSTCCSGSNNDIYNKDTPKVFLAYAGINYEDGSHRREEFGAYWSSTAGDPEDIGAQKENALAWDTECGELSASRYFGYSVRCVKE